jgi:hypothetical protein
MHISFLFMKYTRDCVMVPLAVSSTCHIHCYRFLLTFTISEHDCGVSHLNVVETNSFKHLTHLSLKFMLGNDVDVKKYLAGCLTSLKVLYLYST